MPPMTIEAVYEQGVLRLSRPIDLAEGTRVDILVIPREAATVNRSPRDIGTSERTKSPAEILSEIAAMASPIDRPTQDARDHDAILYGEPAS